MKPEDILAILPKSAAEAPAVSVSGDVVSLTYTEAALDARSHADVAALRKKLSVAAIEQSDVRKGPTLPTTGFVLSLTIAAPAK